MSTRIALTQEFALIVGLDAFFLVVDMVWHRLFNYLVICLRLYNLNSGKYCL